MLRNVYQTASKLLKRSLDTLSHAFFINFGLFEARVLDQNCLKSFPKDCVKDQTMLVLYTEHSWHVVSWSQLMLFPFSLDPDPFCSCLTSSALILHWYLQPGQGKSDLMRENRSDEIWSHTGPHIAPWTPPHLRAVLPICNIPITTGNYSMWIDILDNYIIMSTLLFKTYFLNSIMWTLINSGRLRTRLWNYWLVYLINLLHQNNK